MELNLYSVLMGIGMVFITINILWYGTAFLRNLYRYDIPKYLPRDEIVAWTMVMMSSIRNWDYMRTRAMAWENYDLGILYVEEEEHAKFYDIFPNVSDIIIYPGKWGRQYATVVTRKLHTIEGRLRYHCTFVGEIKNGKLHRGRTATSYKIIS